MDLSKKHSEGATKKSKKLDKIQILCVDGYRENHDVITLILEQRNYEVTTAHTPQDALRLAQNRKFDLYILDSWLPERSEYELCRQIRKIDDHTPLLIYSPISANSNIQEALAAGAQGYLQKPSNPQKLIQIITDLINNAGVQPTK
ncbi:MAG: response regulator [Acidobacteria bacterium]|nr:response regulator [Acidobacteriota bacterium]